MNKCDNCGKLTSNPRFCSRSCSAKITNSEHPRRKKKWKCTKCNAPVNPRNRYCPECRPDYRDWSKVTIDDLQGLRSYQISSRIRDLARRAYKKSGKPLKCSKCGYTPRVHICHILGISDFDPSSTISEVNDLDNLVALCPNHHWEFDNGLISI
jgi:hypothetical protein